MPNREFGEECVRLWIVLTSMATQKQFITYKELSEKADVPFGKVRGKSAHLREIHRQCLIGNLPPLDSIVVLSKPQGRGINIPSGGYEPIINVEYDQTEVFNYDWSDVFVPDAEDFI